MSSRSKQSIGFWVGAGLIGLITLMAVVSTLPWLGDPTLIHVAEKLRPPSSEHWLGSDQLGRDVLGLTLRGAVASLLVAGIAVAIGAGIGVPLGLIAAAREGWISQAIMRTNDFIFAFPALVIAILLHDTVGAGMLNAMLAIGLFNVPVFARTAYGKAQSIWTLDFIRAARLAGKGDVRIALGHVLPLILATVWEFWRKRDFLMLDLA
jgi:peptide/nickel transport system permease protein